MYDVTIAPPKAGDYEIKVGLKDTTNPKNLIGGKGFVVKLEPPGIQFLKNNYNLCINIL